MKVGQLVKYWKGIKRGEPTGIAKIQVISLKHENNFGCDVAWLEGVSGGCVAFSHIEIC